MLASQPDSVKLTLNDQRSVGTNEHGASTHTTDRTSGTLLVDGNVTSKHDSVPAVPRFTLHPVDGVEEGSGRTVASVLGVDTLNIVVTRGVEEVHEDGLCSLGFVNQGLGSDVETTNGGGVNVVLGK
jgi:hypothetical protein